MNTIVNFNLLYTWHLTVEHYIHEDISFIMYTLIMSWRNYKGFKHTISAKEFHFYCELRSPSETKLAFNKKACMLTVTEGRLYPYALIATLIWIYFKWIVPYLQILVRWHCEQWDMSIYFTIKHIFTKYVWIIKKKD